MFFIEVSLGMCLVGIGYIVGRFDWFVGTMNPSSNATLSRRGTQVTKKKIEIDDAKFVTQLDTEKYERGFSELGNIKISSDDVGSAANKLSKLKGK